MYIYCIVSHFHQILSCVQAQSHMSSHGFLCLHLDRLNLPLDSLLLDHFVQNSPSCSRVLRKKFFLSETYIQQLYIIVLKCAIPCNVQFKKKIHIFWNSSSGSHSVPPTCSVISYLLHMLKSLVIVTLSSQLFSVLTITIS